MTDDPATPDDELVSAVLDGEADADEAARVASDPDAAARLARFRELAEAVGRPPAPMPADRVDAAVERALTVARPDPAAVPDLTAGARTRRRAHRLGLVLAAAAALAVIVGLGALAAHLAGSGSRGASTAANGAASGTAIAAPTGSLPTAATGAPLGAFPDVDALVAAARASSPATAPTLPSPAAGEGSGSSTLGDACRTVLVRAVGERALVAIHPAELAGEPVHVAVVRRPDAAVPDVVIVADRDCRVVADVTG